jgi:hypothetical protein
MRVLESFNDSQHGYLGITVTKKSIVCEYAAFQTPARRSLAR